MRPKPEIKVYLLILTSLIFALGLFGTGYAQQPVFRVGVFAEPESTLARGAALKVAQINANGGVRGADGTFFTLELVFAPTQNGQTTAEAVQQLAQANVIAAITPPTTAEVTTTLPLLSQLGVPLLTPASGDNLIIADANRQLFRVSATDFLIERGLAEYLINEQRFSQIRLVQFDADATVKSLGFQTAALAFGVPVPSAALVLNADQIATAAAETFAQSPQAVVTYGDVALAAQFYSALQAAGYTGAFAHPQVNNAAFQENIPTRLNLYGAGTWTYSAPDPTSDTFLADYARQYAQLPDELAAIGADAISLLEIAIGQPGELRTNLNSVSEFAGIQGLLEPAQLNPGESSENALVYRLNDYGAPEVVARYNGTEKLVLEEIVAGVFTPTPAPTATPDGVVATVISNQQNVRLGPSTSYAVIGQLQQGDQIRIIGANADFSWLVIEFRGQQGWIANLPNLNEIFGSLNTVPFITPPPTPTPAATSTPAPPQNADIVIQAASVSPNPIIPGAEFNITVTVANVGRTNAGTFAVAANMPPNNAFVSATVNGLAAGQTTTATLRGTLQNTGRYSVIIVADLNNQVDEGEGEANNDDFSFTYLIDRPTVNSGTATQDGGNTFNLSGSVTINWNGQFFNAASGQIGFINGVALNDVHYDLISTAVANQGSIQPQVGSVVGVRNADGRRAALRVDAINGTQITITYKAYD